MTDDKQLADRVVALGVVARIDLQPPHSGHAYHFDPMDGEGWLILTDESLVHDWRVAGAIETECIKRGFRICSDETGCEVLGYNSERDWHVIGRGLNQEPVRDRIEACCEALEGT